MNIINQYESNSRSSSCFKPHRQTTQNSMTFNIHTVYQVGGEVSGDIPLRPVGTAVYSRTVLLNHSCSGNTARCRIIAFHPRV